AKHAGDRTSRQAAVICSVSQASCSDCLVRRHQREVGPLSRGVISPEGSTPIRPATGRPSLPPSSSTRRPFGPPYGGPTPKGGRRAYHVPRTYQGWFRLCLFAGGSDDDDRGREIPLYLATYLLVQASQRLWLAGSHDVYQQFTWVSHAIHTWPPTAVALAVVRSSRERPGHPDRVRLRCPKSFAPSDYSGRTSWWGTSGRTLGYVLVVRPVITGTSAASCHNPHRARSVGAPGSNPWSDPAQGTLRPQGTLA